ncbi:polysaccharide biosynthesis tyrosine autokinase [Hydrocarboniphaga sp.]|uniref:polysaccharide biosynthesis tyrosine autokinase n=1 Tax=Hydrocarboniphaga sp. TaxID=2033016 RepID=UPI002ABBF47B|nr:polysaccharide biosynthesis tyrosine autokinase [Hydrocarboniphaga sp.]MDZ4078354.1 polysaccharide biosynthesis tyrosine autokinase [Hydrocarboniphaga sp.]
MISDSNHPAGKAPAQSFEEGDELDLAQLFAVLWSGRWILITSTIATCILGVLYLISAKPVFEANGMVQVEQDGKSMSSAMGDLASIFGAPMETEAEIQILKSRMVLNKVIDNLNLLITAEPEYLPIVGAFIARKRGKNGLLNPLFGWNDFAWSAEQVEVTRFEVPEDLQGSSYTLIARGLDRYSLQDPDGKTLFEGIVGQETQINTPAGKVQIFVRDLIAHEGTRFVVIRWPRAEVISRIQERLKVAEQGKQSGVIGITVQGPKATYVADVIQQIEDAYVRQNVERRSAEAEQSLEFLQQQLPEIKARVDAAQSKLNTYQQSQGSVNVTKETELVLQQSVELETKKLELIGQRQQAIQRFTSQHPIVQALDAQIKGLENEQSTIRKRTETLPETQQEVLSLMRDLEVNTQIYTTLLNSAQELQVAKAGTVGNVRIIDYPMVPDKKTKPSSAIIGLISIVAGLGLGVGYLFLQKALFRGVYRPDEVEKALGLSTYAAIPYTVTQKRLAQSVQRKQNGNHLLADAEPDNVAIEALRSLRTAIQFALLESPNNIIMFTGPTPGLGKSFVSVNLAAVLAQGGKKVVVVDGDLRRGHLHKYIGQTASPGLSDYIAGNADLQSIIRKTSIDGLTMVSNGTMPPNPSELLLNERFANLLTTLSQSHDLVIIDTPPVLPVTDASIVGRLAGCVLLILKEGAHHMRSVEETARRLRQGGVHIRGTVFNQVGQRGAGYGYSYYYSSYGYTYGTKYKSDERL